MTPKRFGFLMAVNVVVSLLVTLAALYAWQSLQGPVSGVGLGLGTPPATRAPVPTQGPPTTVPMATKGPLVYRVQPGDTLSSIAARYDVSVQDIMTANGLTNPNALTVGQELIIPVGGLPTATPVPPTATVAATPPTPIATATPVPGGAALLKIAGVLNPGALADEAVLITNDGSPVRLDGWTLSGAGGNTYTFPSLMLWTGGAVTVHSGPGQDRPTDLYWARDKAAWQHGEIVLLKDAQGKQQASFTAP